ncbi:MAG: hypothetical protein K9K82_10130 [Desulfobacteraceae bacterium]|nr:hypothetical protein [Desulfobacteraceae bacterium]
MSQLISVYVNFLDEQGLKPRFQVNNYDLFRSWWRRYVGDYPPTRQKFQKITHNILNRQND